MKKLTATLLALCLLLTCSAALADETYARLNTRIATRSGPGTMYFEPGSFLSQGDYVTVHTKVWDGTNEIWWVQVEFREGHASYRAYTGAWRMNVDLSQVPEEQPLGVVYLTRDADVFAGPGWDYQLWNDTVRRGTSAVLMEVENGYGHIECWNDTWDQPWRVWAPLSCLSCAGDYTLEDDTYPDAGGSESPGEPSCAVYPIGETCCIRAESGNARCGAGTAYAIVEYVFRGERFTILDTAVAANGRTWYMIRKDGNVCWVSSGICTVE